MGSVPAKGRMNAKWQYQPSDKAGAGNSSSQIRCQPTATVEYHASELGALPAGVFYVPKSSRQVGFDSLLLVDQVLYLSVYDRRFTQD